MYKKTGYRPNRNYVCATCARMARKMVDCCGREVKAMLEWQVGGDLITGRHEAMIYRCRGIVPAHTGTAIYFHGPRTATLVW